MGNITLASSLEGKAHLTAWDKLFEIRFLGIELEKLLIMMIDTVDSKALIHLADQFDLLGVKGWNAAKTEQDRRNLIKRAIELKRYQGTNYAIRRAVQSVGYYDAEIIEAAGAFYDGKFFHDGFLLYGGGNWASIAVVLDLGDTKGISDEETGEAIDLINEYKNARTRLIYISYKSTLIDTVQVEEDFKLALDVQTVEGVDPLNEVTELVARVTPWAENFNTLADGGLTINFINLAGDVIQQDTF